MFDILQLLGGMILSVGYIPQILTVPNDRDALIDRLRHKIKERNENMSNFYISDTHFGHANIIRYDNRPFKTPDDMDAAIIDRWNDVISDEDTVYILGDFSWHKEDMTLDIIDRLPGKKVLIKGNHDRVSPKIARKFSGIYDYLEINDGNERVVMSHYPMIFWNGQFRDTVHLYGHVHNSHQWNICESYKKELQQLQDIPMRMYNVGCMMEWMDYTPQPLSEILKSTSLKK